MGVMARKPHTEYINSLDEEVLQSNTEGELAQMATDHCGYFVSPNVAQHARRKALNASGIMGVDRNSSLKGDKEMAEPTEAQSQALLQECLEQGIDVSAVKYFWHKSKRISMFVVLEQRRTLRFVWIYARSI